MMGRNTWGGRSRKRHHSVRRRKTTVLVVGEGQATEPDYFHKLKMEDAVASRFHVTVKRGKGGSRLDIVREAVNRKKDPGAQYDEAWCVMDVEKLESRESRKDLRDAVNLAKKEKLSLCLSNPAFEVWFLSHFLRTSQHFSDCDAVIVVLDQHWRDTFGGSGYSKTDERIYDRLRHRMDDAIRNAHDVRTKDHRCRKEFADCNSCTDVYVLVRRLLGK